METKEPKYKVLICDKLSAKGVEILDARPELEVAVKTGMPEAELCKCIADYDAMVIRSGTSVTEQVINHATGLKVIGRAGIGTDNVNIPAATRRGIVVMNTPGGNTITTAEHTMAMMMALARNIPSAVAAVKRGEWKKSKYVGTELFGKTLGLIGLGRIGSVVARRAIAFHMKVIAYDPYISSETASESGVKLVSLDELFEQAEIISLHVPLSDATKGIIGGAALRKVKQGVLIVNCARGGLVDEDALLNAIEAGRVGGAALDVLVKEPPESVTRLIEHERVIVSPHLGASTREAQDNVAVAVAEQIAGFLLEGVIRNAVNVPCVPTEVLDKVRPHLALAEILGNILSQISQGAVKEVVVSSSGEPVSSYSQAVAVAALKGVLEPAVKDVNTVNAPVIAKSRGITLSEAVLPPGDYANFIKLELRTEAEMRTMAATVLRRCDARVLSLDGYFLEAKPTPAMLVVINKDRPGVVGRIGTILGKHKVNIVDMHLGCKVRHGTAASIYNLEGPVSQDVIKEIAEWPFVLDVRLVRLSEALTAPVSGRGESSRVT